jgi:hypothetical protein
MALSYVFFLFWWDTKEKTLISTEQHDTRDNKLQELIKQYDNTPRISIIMQTIDGNLEMVSDETQYYKRDGKWLSLKVIP